MKKSLVIVVLCMAMFGVKELNADELANSSAENMEILSESGTMPVDFSVTSSKVNIGANVESSTSISSGYVRTIGGSSSTEVMYTSVSDADQKTNGVGVSGAGFDGIYLDSEIFNDITYIKFAMSGGIFYMPSSELALISDQDTLASSHYENINGDWVYLSAVDIATSTEYTSYVIGSAPSWSSEGVKYYTIDEQNFYESKDKAVASVNQSGGVYRASASLSGASYYQNLPLLSASNYTGADFKNYLSYKGKTGSQYYNSTNAFVEAQNLQGVNSLLLFAFANHEGAYGQSNFSKTCNNFFGLGAYDSNPGNACSAYAFNTPRDGILGQSLFIRQGFFDVYDYRFNGMHFGNKASGMNVKYASDPDWGKKIAAFAYETDRYLGSADFNLYTIGSIRSTTVYQDSALKYQYKGIKNMGDKTSYTYTIRQQEGNSSSSDYGVKVILNKNMTSSYQIQLPTAINNNSGGTCSYVKVTGGAYPNYKGKTAYNVPVGTASFACDYKYADELGYVSKGSVTILNSGNYTSPSQVINGGDNLRYEYHTNGNIKKTYHLNDKDYILYVDEYNDKGVWLRRINYQNNTPYVANDNSKYINKQVCELNSDKSIKYCSFYNTSNKIYQIREYKAGTNFSNMASNEVSRYVVNSNSEILYKITYGSTKNELSHTYYVANTKYGAHKGKELKVFYFNSKLQLTYGEVLSNQKVSNILEFNGTYNNTNYLNAEIKSDFQMDTTNNTIKQELVYTDGVITQYNSFLSGTKYTTNPKIKTTSFFVDKNNYITSSISYDTKGVIQNKRYYKANTKISDVANNVVDEYTFDSAGNITLHYVYEDLNVSVVEMYESSDKVTEDNISTKAYTSFDVDSNGYVFEGKKYQSDGSLTQLVELTKKVNYYNITMNISKIYYFDELEQLTKVDNYIDGKVRQVNYVYDGYTYDTRKQAVNEEIYLLNANGHVLSSTHYTNSGVIDQHSEYARVLTINQAVNHPLRTYFVKADNELIRVEDYYDTGEINMISTYNSGVKYASQSTSTLKDITYLNKNQTIKYQMHYTKGVISSRSDYVANTQYSNIKTSAYINYKFDAKYKVVSSTNVNSNQKIVSYNKYSKLLTIGEINKDRTVETKYYVDSNSYLLHSDTLYSDGATNTITYYKANIKYNKNSANDVVSIVYLNQNQTIKYEMIYKNNVIVGRNDYPGGTQFANKDKTAYIHYDFDSSYRVTKSANYDANQQIISYNEYKTALLINDINKDKTVITKYFTDENKNIKYSETYYSDGKVNTVSLYEDSTKYNSQNSKLITSITTLSNTGYIKYEILYKDGVIIGRNDYPSNTLYENKATSEYISYTLDAKKRVVSSINYNNKGEIYSYNTYTQTYLIGELNSDPSLSTSYIVDNKLNVIERQTYRKNGNISSITYFETTAKYYEGFDEKIAKVIFLNDSKNITSIDVYVNGVKDERYVYPSGTTLDNYENREPTQKVKY